MIVDRLCSKVLLSSALLAVGCVGGSDLGSANGGAQVDGGVTGAQRDFPGAALVTGPLPDLVETTVGDPPASAVLGQGIPASDTVTNQGSADAGASYTKYYLTASGTTPQYLLGDRSVGAIAVGSSDSGSATVTVPAGVPQGNYRMLACADSGSGAGGRVSQVPESNESNNCTASGGSVAITGPDLTESNVAISPTTIDAFSGTLTVSETVHNIGSGMAGASVTRWWLSTDNVKDAGDAFIRNCTNGEPIPGRNVGAISGGGVSTGGATTTPLCVRDANGLHPPANGTYYVIACADTTNEVSELNENNNCAVSASTVQVTNSNIDLIESSVSDPPTNGMPGISFPITDTAQNIGTDPAPSSFTKFYLSTNGKALNAYLNTRSVGALGAGATDTATTTMTIAAGTASGTYHVVACADSGPGKAGRTSQIVETNENNNCTASVGTITLVAPDLVVFALSNPPATGSAGTTFSLTDTTANVGIGDDGGSFFNKYYLSANGTSPAATLPGAGYLGTSAAFSPLAAGTNEMMTTTAKVAAATPPATYFVIGCADAGPGTGGRSSQVAESNENNNCKAAATKITIN